MQRTGGGAVEDMWPGGRVCLKPTCVCLDEVVAGKEQAGERGGSGRSARRQMLAWPTPSRKYQKALYEVL